MLGRRIRRLHYSILLLRYCIHLPEHCRHFISIPPSLLFFAYNINKFLYPQFRPARCLLCLLFLTLALLSAFCFCSA
uniref:Uncharacterized protein n=1 Tax=Saccharolobus islandicus TaxID=43080 RepID=Q0ZNU6_SACIS|nr:hypothetical protein [Sulfolobus islandicus]